MHACNAIPADCSKLPFSPFSDLGTPFFAVSIVSIPLSISDPLDLLMHSCKLGKRDQEPGIPPQIKYKSMSNFMQNESVSIPTTISQNRSTLDPVPGNVHFDFVNQEGMPANMEDVNQFCYRSLQIKLKEWRCELKKKGYMKGKNEELSVEPPEQRITQVTWDCLVQYWRTDEKIREFERNQKNRAQEQATHTLGAKSIARHNQEQREKLGDSYTTLGAYIKAHQTKGGDYPNEYTRSICEKVIETCQEKDLMSSSEPTILSPILDAVCNGHHGGFERGYGLGWSRMSRWGDSGNQASNYNIKQLTIELQNAKAK
ncbi:hypothetical protein Taro_011052 [Colocasia esculenta]|uniref:Uncharacterized protein n=1 Tax=Colocasia esculenta TaxID=4460 RepID=A0A843U9X2_COLES|nr:hypothetical protein [Colocasia esculenta]